MLDAYLRTYGIVRTSSSTPNLLLCHRYFIHRYFAVIKLIWIELNFHSNMALRKGFRGVTRAVSCKLWSLICYCWIGVEKKYWNISVLVWFRTWDGDDGNKDWRLCDGEDGEQTAACHHISSVVNCVLLRLGVCNNKISPNCEMKVFRKAWMRRLTTLQHRSSDILLRLDSMRSEECWCFDEPYQNHFSDAGGWSFVLHILCEDIHQLHSYHV